MKIIIVIALEILLCSFKTLPKGYRGFTKKELAIKIDKVRTHQSSTKRARYKPNRMRQELERYKKINSFSPVFDNEFGSISTFERFYGTIDGNIISSGYPIGFKVDISSDSKFPEDSYLACTGTNHNAKYNYRIIATCDRLITDDGEYRINASIKDLKKIEGIKPDHIYTGDAEAVLGEGFSAIMGAIIDARKDVATTAIGFAVKPSDKNTLLTGLKSGARLANQKTKEHSANQTTILAVKDKTKIIIEFKRSFSYEKDSRI